MKSTSLHVFFLFTVLLLLTGCPQVIPDSSNFACSHSTCADSQPTQDAKISSQDIKIAASDTAPTNDTLTIDAKVGLCPDPNNMPDSCRPTMAKLAKCQKNICDSSFLKDTNCSIDADCQKIPSYEESESIAKKGTCTGLSNDKCEIYGWKCAASSSKAGQDCNNDVDCQVSACKDGWFAGAKCATNTDCQINPIPPCSCWSFCKFLGNWESESIKIDFASIQENNGLCLIISNSQPPLKYAGKIGNSTIESGLTELRFDEYCERTTTTPKFGSCSVKETCLEVNSCGFGTCNYADDLCTSDQDCFSTTSSCHNQKCSLSGECSKQLSNSPNNCPAVYAPCIAANESHMIQKVCSEKGSCAEKVFTKNN